MQLAALKTPRAAGRWRSSRRQCCRLGSRPTMRQELCVLAWHSRLCYLTASSLQLCAESALSSATVGPLGSKCREE